MDKRNHAKVQDKRKTHEEKVLQNLMEEENVRKAGRNKKARVLCDSLSYVLVPRH